MKYIEPIQWDHVFFLNMLRNIIRGFPSKMLHFELLFIPTSLPSYESFPWISVYKVFDLDPSVIVTLWEWREALTLILRSIKILSILTLPSYILLMHTSTFFHSSFPLIFPCIWTSLNPCFTVTYMLFFISTSMLVFGDIPQSTLLLPR